VATCLQVPAGAAQRTRGSRLAGERGLTGFVDQVGHDHAVRAAHDLLEERGRIGVRCGSRQHTTDEVLPEGSAALERFIGANLQRQLSVDQMAHATATSPRTLARKLEHSLGTTPLHFAQRLRIAQAAHLLETTRRTVDDIAAAVGYADAAAFRRVFRRETGDSPRARRSQRRTVRER